MHAHAAVLVDLDHLAMLPLGELGIEANAELLEIGERALGDMADRAPAEMIGLAEQHVLEDAGAVVHAPALRHLRRGSAAVGAMTISGAMAVADLLTHRSRPPGARRRQERRRPTVECFHHYRGLRRHKSEKELSEILIFVRRPRRPPVSA